MYLLYRCDLYMFFFLLNMADSYFGAHNLENTNHGSVCLECENIFRMVRSILKIEICRLKKILLMTNLMLFLTEI